MSSRSHTLTEEGNPFASTREMPPTPVQPVTPRPFDITEHYMPRLGVLRPNDYPAEWKEGLRSGKSKDIPWYDQWKRGVQLILAEPEQAGAAEAENSRAAACRQALESPLAPQSSAIPQSKIASYPREWRDGARSGKYSYIPSYQGWRRGEQPELAHSEQSSPSDFVEQPLHGNPGPSTRSEPIEQPAFEGPRRSSRVQQQRQRPDNVYGDDPFVDHLTDSQWDTIMSGEFLVPATQRLGRRPISYVATSVISLSLPRALLNQS